MNNVTYLVLFTGWVSWVIFINFVLSGLLWFHAVKFLNFDYRYSLAHFNLYCKGGAITQDIKLNEIKEGRVDRVLYKVPDPGYPPPLQGMANDRHIKLADLP